MVVTWTASFPRHFNLVEKVRGTHWIGGWVGPRASQDVVGKEKPLAPTKTWIPITQLSNLHNPVSFLFLAFMYRQKTLYLLLLSLLFLFLITKKLLNSNKSFLMPYLNESTIEKQNMSATNLKKIGYKTASYILLLPCILSQLTHQPTNTLNV